MKKLLMMMCIGGLMALCAPLTASESPVDPPITRHITLKKGVEPTEKTLTPIPADAPVVSDNNKVADPEPAHSGGVVVISGAALLLIIILLIILL